nr:hypothetical protein [Streptomyces cupreus]
MRTSKRLTEQAVKVVHRAVPGSMPDVEVILTSERGMAECVAAAHLALAGSLGRSVVRRAEGRGKQTARDAHACAIPRPDGSALVIVNVNHLPAPSEFARIIVHELVHCMQFSRKDVADEYVSAVREGLGIERRSRRQRRGYDRMVQQDEYEAYGREYLADQLIPGATAA